MVVEIGRKAGHLPLEGFDIAAAYTGIYGATVEPVYGASGALGDRLAKGEIGDVFTSADLGYPEALTPRTVLALLLKPDVKIGTSSPASDPGGAYAWAMFKKADIAKPGSGAVLEAKALKTGSPEGPLSVPPDTKNATVWLLEHKKLDAFLSYCTNGHTAAEQLPGIKTVELPAESAVTADYGLTVLKNANYQQGAQFALFILSPQGQKILADHGFDAPLQP